MNQKRLLSDLDTVEDAEFIDTTADDISDLQKDIDEQMDSIFQEFGGDNDDTEFKINVKRVMPGQGELEHCFGCLPSELPIMERIRTEYGPGAYQIWIYKNGKIFKRRKINIAKPIKKIEQNPINNSGDTNELIKTLLASQQEQMSEFKNLMLQTMQPSQPISDPTQMMGAMMGVLVQMKEFIGPQTSKADMLFDAVKLVKEIGSEAGDRTFMDSMVDLAKSFGPPLMEMAKRTPNPAPQYHAQPIGQQEAPVNEAEQMNAIFAAQLNMLVQKAIQGADPDLYAELILDNADPQQIKAFIDQPDYLEKLKQINPGVAQVEVWFISLRNILNAILTNQDIDDTSTNDPSGEGETPA